VSLRWLLGEMVGVDKRPSIQIYGSQGQPPAFEACRPCKSGACRTRQSSVGVGKVPAWTKRFSNADFCFRFLSCSIMVSYTGGSLTG